MAKPEIALVALDLHTVRETTVTALLEKDRLIGRQQYLIVATQRYRLIIGRHVGVLQTPKLKHTLQHSMVYSEVCNTDNRYTILLRTLKERSLDQERWKVSGSFC
jgi:hypothetical protein